MTVPVVTAEAEAASALLFRTLGAHRTAVANLPAAIPSRRLSDVGDDRAQIQCQATLLRMLSITESFCAERLLLESEQLVTPSRNQAVANLWDAAAVEATNSWAEQKRAYQQWLGVEPDWKPIDCLAEARNAVAHGLGTLTRRQRRKEESVKAKIKQAGIAMEGDRVVLSNDTLAAVAAACRTVIEEVDLAVQQRPLQYL
jgi:hypothetical protein